MLINIFVVEPVDPSSVFPLLPMRRIPQYGQRLRNPEYLRSHLLHLITFINAMNISFH